MSWNERAAELMARAMADGREAVNGTLRRPLEMRVPDRRGPPVISGGQKGGKSGRKLALNQTCRKKARMANRGIRIAGLWAALLLGACAGTPAPVTVAEPPAPAPALWKVADEDTTIYLFGTIHVLPEDLAWFEPHIAGALAASDELVTEIETGDAAAMGTLVAEKARLPEGQKLRDLMTDEQRKAYDEVMVSLGLPVDSLDGYEPWYAGVNLSLIPLLVAGYDPEHGVEAVLQERAPATARRAALETAAYQLGLFDSLPQELQLEYLHEIVAAVPSINGEIDRIIATWLAGDATALAGLMNAEETDATLYQRFIIDRNVHWAVWIDDRLDRPGTVFMAVGAGHLAGQGSVQEQLEARGISSARVR